jgi:hypothetical protein
MGILQRKLGDIEGGSKPQPHCPPAQSQTDVNEWLDALIEAYPAELSTRVEQTSQIPVFEVTGPGGALVPSGSLLIVSAHPADEVLGAITEAARAGDAGPVSHLLETVERNQNRAPRWQPGDADPVAVLRDVDTFSTVSYEATAIAHALLIKDALPISVTHIPFNGGRLLESAFVAHHYHNSPQRRASSIVIVCRPDCSDVEKRLSDEYSAVSADELVGPLAPEANWLIAGALILIVGAGLAAAYVLARRAQRANQGPPEQRHLTQEFIENRAWLERSLAEVSEITPECDARASAGDLIALRAELLKKSLE